MTHEEQRQKQADTVATKIWHAQNCDPGECICNLICRGDLDDISAEFGIAAALAQAAQEAVTKVEAARDLNWSFFLSEQELTNGLREEMQKLKQQLAAMTTKLETLSRDLKAVIKERDDLNNVLRQAGWGQGEIDSAAYTFDNLATANTGLVNERDRLKEALGFYADPQTYGISGGSVDRIIQDAGKQANAALRGEIGGA